MCLFCTECMTRVVCSFFALPNVLVTGTHTSVKNYTVHIDCIYVVTYSYVHFLYTVYTEAEFLDEIQTKVCISSQKKKEFYLEISTVFLQLTRPLTIFTLKLMYTLKEKGGKPDENHTTSLCFKKSIQKSQV
jgi:hypothetical protein